MEQYDMNRNLLLPLAGLVSAFILISCGGSSEPNEELSAPNPLSVETPVATVEAPVATEVTVVGPISDFGSLIVNGVRYNTDNAEITLNGESAAQDDLDIGQIIRLEGTINSDGETGIATRVDYFSSLIGPVESIDLNNGTIEVLGFTVQLANEGVGASIGGSSLSTLSLGDVVEISGTNATDIVIDATFIEPVEKVTELIITGSVRSLNTAEQFFTLGSLTIDYSVADIIDGELSNNKLIQATGRLDANNRFNASAIVVQDLSFTTLENSHVSIFGMVRNDESTANFQLNGISVTIADSAKYLNGTEADLIDMALIKINGVVNAEGELVAEVIEFIMQPNAGLAGVIDQIDTETITVMGTTIIVQSDRTRIEDLGSYPATHITLLDLNLGDYVIVLGSETDDGMLATRITRSRNEEVARIFGVVDSTNAPSLQVQGVEIVTSSETSFFTTITSFFATISQTLTSEDFFSVAPDKTVLIEGSWEGQSLNADTVKIISDCEQVCGDGDTDTYERPETVLLNFAFDDFDSVSIQSPYSVSITQGVDFSIEIEIDKTAADLVEVTSEMDTLTIALDNTENTIIETLRATIVMPALTSAEFAVAAAVTLDSFNEDNLSLIIRNAVAVNLTNMTLDALDATLSGASTLEADALSDINSLKLSASGLSSVNFENSAAMTSAQIKLQTVSNATVNIAEQGFLTGALSTISSLSYYGTNITVDVEVDALSSLNNLGNTR